MRRVRTWWQQRQRRKLLRRLARTLDEEAVTAADHSSAALLATLTECLARMTSARASPKQIGAALALARRTYDEYQPSIERCRALRDQARGEAEKWQHNVARAIDAGAPELAILAQQRVELWQRRERDATVALDEGIAGLNRLADALTQLQRFAERVL